MRMRRIFKLKRGWRQASFFLLPLTLAVCVVMLVSCWPPDPDPDPSPEITVIDVPDNISRRFGAPQIAVNPTDPNNIVLLASMNFGFTNKCQEENDPDCELIPQYINNVSMGKAPRGFYKTRGFCDVGVFVTFDRGKTWQEIDVSQLSPIGHPEIMAKGEGPLMATADGTFYIGFNAINWGDWEADPPVGFPNGGVGMIKSSDKGLTWEGAWLTGTPADWPFGAADVSTGTLYSVSGVPASTLGSRSTGDPNAEEGEIGDRWISASTDGMNWTEPQPLGTTNALGQHVSASHTAVTAANGEVATMFKMMNRRACRAYVGNEAAMPCVIFQTSKDDGKTWNPHRMPVANGFTPSAGVSLMLAADPSTPGHYTTVIGSQDATIFHAYQTNDSGKTWSGPTVLTEDDSKTHWGAWTTYSQEGVLGVIWKTNEPEPGAARGEAAPYSVWAAISHDGGATFSKPLKLTKKNSPPPSGDGQWNTHIGDHGPSAMELDDVTQTAYIAWGDWSPGERTIMFSAIDFETFK